MIDGTIELVLSVAATRSLDEATRREIVDLCTRAFEKDEFGEMFDLVADSVDPTHVLGHIQGRLVGHAICSTRRVWIAEGLALRSAHLDAVATDPNLQGQGIGTAVVQRLMNEIAGFDIGTLSTHRQSFYARMGWLAWNGPTARRRGAQDVTTTGEPVMVLKTARTPALDLSSLLVIEARRGDSW